MKMNAVRSVMLGTIFVIVIMAIYFSLLPGSSEPGSHSSHNHQLNLHVTTQVTQLKTIPVPPKSPLQLAKDIFDKHGVVLFTMVNNAFFPFAASWCCNTAPFGNIHQQVLFLTTDMETGRKLKRLWPNVSVVSLNETQFSGEQQYSRTGYVLMMAERTRYILRYLEAGVRLLLFEVDCLWLSDPVPQLMAHKAGGDIFATRVSDRDQTAGGFLLLNPTPATIKLWKRLTQKMDDLYQQLKDQRQDLAVSEGLNDQVFFSSLVKSKYAGVKTVYLSPDLYPDGKWYKLQEKVRSSKPRPIIINNNWVVGEKAKVKRAKAFGHWFWNDVGEGSCNSTAVHNLLH